MIFSFSKSKKQQPEATQQPPSKSLFAKLSHSLKRTRDNLTGGLAHLILGKKTIDANLLEELETTLLLADVGIDASQEILNSLSQKVARKELANPEALIRALKQLLL